MAKKQPIKGPVFYLINTCNIMNAVNIILQIIDDQALFNIPITLSIILLIIGFSLLYWTRQKP